MRCGPEVLAKRNTSLNRALADWICQAGLLVAARFLPALFGFNFLFMTSLTSHSIPDDALLRHPSSRERQAQHKQPDP